MKKIIPFITLMILFTHCEMNDMPDIQKDPTSDAPTGANLRMAPVFPDLIPLPTGFSPEGIVNGKGSEFFVGSLVGGGIYKGDLRTGAGMMLVDQENGKQALGLDYDERTDYLFAAGLNGVGYVYQGTNGMPVATIPLNALSFPQTFINDVVITRNAVYFTDSFQDVFYRVPLLNTGEIPDPLTVEEIELTGDFTFLPWTDPTNPAINANGIVASADGKTLIIGNSMTGILYAVDPWTGVADEIDLGGSAVPNADGLVLNGKTLYVVQNFTSQITEIELSHDLKSGEIIRVITHPDLIVPSTATWFGNSIYAVNARFDLSLPPFFGGDPTGIEYDVIRMDKN